MTEHEIAALRIENASLRRENKILLDREGECLRFVQEAIDSISLEMWRGNDPQDMARVDTVEATIAIELERVDSAIGIRGTSMFSTLAEQIKQCAIALFAARDNLIKER